MEHSLASLSLIGLIVLSLFLVNAGQFSSAATPTPVSGIISTDTTWWEVNSPYVLTGNVLVNVSVNLTIAPGVSIDFNGYYLRVNGTLKAQGTSANKIMFTMTTPSLSSSGDSAIEFKSSSQSWNPQTGSGSIIENVVINASQNYYSTPYSSVIFVDSVSPKINNNLINCSTPYYWQRPAAINIQGTNPAPLISNNTIIGAVSAIGGLFYNNSIQNPSSTALYINGNTTVVGNTISDSNAGIQISQYFPYYCPFSCLIQDNLLANDIHGLECSLSVSSPCPTLVVQNNTFSNNTDGIYLTSGWGSAPNANYSIINNNMFSNGYNFALGPGVNYDVNASGNWWGTVDSQAIGRSIYDFDNDFNLGTVNFTSFLTMPNLAAPTLFIIASAGGNGLITPSGVLNVNYGDSQTFSITPSSGYYTSGVFVNGTSIGQVNCYSYTVQNITYATSISAIFTANPTITSSVNGSGGYIDSWGTYSVTYGGNKSYSIMPWGGYYISGVFVNGTFVSQASYYNVQNITGTTAFTAAFASNPTVNASTGPGGSISPSGTVSVNYGGNQTFTISPYFGYHVANILVNGTSVGTFSSYTIQNVTGVTNISAAFALNPSGPTITASVSTYGGTINPSGTFNVTYGGNQTFMITPYSGYYIVNVSVNGTSVGAISSYTLQNVTGPTSVSVTFAPTPSVVTASVNSYGGSISPSGTIFLSFGGNLTFSITPYSCYHTVDVFVNGTSVGSVSSYSVQNVTGPTTISATFASNPTITAFAGIGGSISPSEIVFVNYGGSQAFVITPHTGCYITGVYVNGSSVGAVSYYIVQNVTGATTVSATFGYNSPPSNAGTVITSNTVWTKENSPYVLTANTLVQNGATLTIEPGVTIYLNDNSLIINGTLIARGTSGNKINFISTTPTLFNSQGVIVFLSGSTGWNEQSQKGSIIENAIVTANQPIPTIYIQAASPKINHCYISPQSYNSYSTAIQISQFSNGAIPAPMVSNNTISNYPNGITDLGNSLILGNYIFDCQTAIIGSGNDTIKNNLIAKNQIGLSIQSNVIPTTLIIQNNTFSENLFGISLNYFSSNGSINGITYNNFEKNTNSIMLSAFFSGPNTAVNATYNWWGTTDAQAINQTANNPDIYGNIPAGTVNFVPFLTTPNPNAPSQDYNPNQAEAPTYTITITHVGSGTVSPSDGQHMVNSPVALTATPSADYVFMCWLDNGTFLSSSNPYNYIATNNDVITAVFYNPNDKTPTTFYKITITHIGEGTVSPADGLQIVDSSITLSAAPGTNYAFMCWLQNGTVLSSSNPYVYSPTNNYVITAVFYDPVAKSSPTPSPTPTPIPTASPTPTPSPTEMPTPNPTTTQNTSPAPTNSPTTNPTAKTEAPDNTPAPSQNSTTIQATTPSGSTIDLPINGNITATQISSVIIETNQPATLTTISFNITGESGTTGFSNMTIPKSAIPYGSTPLVYVDNEQAQNQGYSQDADNYYVWFLTHFSTHQVSIHFTEEVEQPQAVSLYLVLAIAVGAFAITACLTVAFKINKTRRKRV